MKYYSDDGTEGSWLTFVIAVIVLLAMWMVLGCLPVGFVFLIAGEAAAYLTASIWAGFVSAWFLISIVKSIVNARKNARIYGK